MFIYKWFICCCFINISNVRPVPFDCACSYPRSTRCSDGLHVLSFACHCGPSRGRSERWMLLPFVSCQYWHVRFLPVIVLFYKVYLENLDIFLCWLLSCVRFGQCLEVSALLLMILFFLKISDVFGGGSEVVSESFQFLPRDLASLYCPIYSGISALDSGSSTFWPLIWRRSFWGILIIPHFPDDRGSALFGGTTSLCPG